MSEAQNLPFVRERKLLGAKIKKLREERHMTQEMLSERSNINTDQLCVPLPRRGIPDSAVRAVGRPLPRRRFRACFQRDHFKEIADRGKPSVAGAIRQFEHGDTDVLGHLAAVEWRRRLGGATAAVVTLGSGPVRPTHRHSSRAACNPCVDDATQGIVYDYH